MFVIPPINRRMFLVAAVAAAISAHSTHHAVAQNDGNQTLEAAMKELSGGVVRYLKTKEEAGIIIGDFKGPDGNHSGMRKRLMDKVKGAGIEIKTRQGLRIDGSFSQDAGNATIDITLTMNDRNNKPVQEFNTLGIQATVSDLEDIAATTGVTVGVTNAKPADGADPKPGDPKPGDPKVVDPKAVVVKPGDPNVVGAKPGDPNAVGGNIIDPRKAVTEAIQKPSFETVNPAGSIVTPNKSTPYRIEVLVRPSDGKGGIPYAPRPVTNEEGQAFCGVKVGEEYAVKIYNDSEYDCAVKLSIDGLNCFEFSEVPDFRALGMWVVPAKSPLLVRGWHITNQRSDSFLVVGQPDSAVGRLGKDTGTVGTINACFFAAWQGTIAPPIEPLGARSGAATGRGIPQSESFATVRRFIGKTMQASITVRYDKPNPDDLPPAE